MRTAVIVTFDLHDVDPYDTSAYKRIKDELAGIMLFKVILKEDASEVSLPANTFAGFFDTPFFRRSVSKVRDRMREKVLEVVERNHHRATVFVFVAKQWAWGRPRLR